MKIFTFVLIAIAVFLTYEVFYGRNGVIQYREVSAQVEALKHKQEQLQRRNQAISDEITDLQQGNLTVEELARAELGMIKPTETFYRVINAEKTEK